MKYYTHSWSGPKLYRCHLGIWNMAYPLIVGGQLVGVLVGGQLIVGGNSCNLVNALTTIRGEVAWNSSSDGTGADIPIEYDPILNVSDSIQIKAELTATEKNDLVNLVRTEALEECVSVSGLVERYQQFKDFGSLLTQVTEDLFRANREAARRAHIYESSEVIRTRGDWLSEEPDSFWITLDEAVRDTLPEVKGYVLLRRDQYQEGFEPIRTSAFDDVFIADRGAFRRLCGHVFEDLRHHEGEGWVVHDVLREHRYVDVLQQVMSNSAKLLGKATIVAIPMREAGKQIVGALVCLSATEADASHTVVDSLSEVAFAFYVEALADIGAVLSTVLARHEVMEAQAAAWATRSHELIAPIHAAKGYQDNLMFLFKEFIEPQVHSENSKETFRVQLNRLGEMCDFLELVVKGGAGEAAKYFVKANIERDAVLPIVQSLRDYAIREKKVVICYEPTISSVPLLYLFADGIKRCLFNLIFNAIKYSNSGSTIVVALEREKKTCVIQVANEGIGVPKGEEELIFQRFRQGSNASIRAAYGAGLGLYVARQIAHLHHGEVVLVSGDPAKTVFALRLPTSLEDGPPVLMEGRRYEDTANRR